MHYVYTSYWKLIFLIYFIISFNFVNFNTSIIYFILKLLFRGHINYDINFMIISEI